MPHQIPEEEVAYDAASTLQEWFNGYMTREDGRQYKVVQVEHDGLRMVIRVESTQYLDVIEEEFEIEVTAKRMET
jgi:hypothetical protein